MQAEIIEDAINRINSSNSQLRISSWKGMDRKTSRIISNILSSIEKADYLLADLTGLNPNVLFEVGYAFGKKKGLLLFIQGNSEQRRKNDLEKIEMLSGLQITPIQNINELVTAIKEYGPDTCKLKPDIDMFGIELSQTPTGALFLQGFTKHEIALEALKTFRAIYPQMKVDDWSED